MVLITSIKHNMMTGTYQINRAQRVPLLTKKLTPKERIFIETAVIKKIRWMLCYLYERRTIMYKVMHWMKSCLSENGFAKIEHYFTDSKEALKVYFSASKRYDNIALVIATEHSEFVFMFHYSDDFPKELRPNTFTQICMEIDSTDKTTSMYDVFENACGFKRPKFRFKQDGSVEEI